MWINLISSSRLFPEARYILQGNILSSCSFVLHLYSPGICNGKRNEDSPNGDLDEVIYMQQTPGYVNKGNENFRMG